MRPSKASWILVVALLLTFAGITGAADKSGVTANTISLPSGPGSIEGLGESFEPTLNTGTAKYGLTLGTPPGTAGHTPGVALAYEGGRGNGPVGFGWRLNIPSIHRQTDKGIPRYLDTANGIDDDRDGLIDEPDELDIFVNEFGEELVPVTDGYHYCENEGAFIRYQRVGDYWQGTLPDGTLREFGLTEQARVTDVTTGHVFRWLLERLTDTNGNTIVYTYRTYPGPENRNQRYLSKITYGAGAPPWVNYHFVAFSYESRSDWFEDARSGFLIRTGMRVAEIAMGTQGPTLEGHLAGDLNGDGLTDYLNRKYALAYQAHPHWSLLTSVTLFGADGGSALPPMTLSYTVADPPESVSASNANLGSVNTPVQVMDDPSVDLADLNGDALPDILRTEKFGGPHSVALNRGEADGLIVWAAVTEIGGDALAGNFNLGSTSGAIAHLADMNGDGRADFVYTSAVGNVYYFPNAADLTWGPRVPMNIDPADASPPSPFGTSHVKTADLDFDKRMDIIQSVSVGQGASYRIWFNLGDGRYSRSVTRPQAAGFTLSDPGVHIADFNGDRVPDIVRVTPAELQVTAGVGYGNFTALRSVPLPDYTFNVNDPGEIARVRLEDITGDGLVDVVLPGVPGNQLYYWINLGNYTLSGRRTITNMPTQLGVEPEIRWADLNGNGTVDLVYADRYAEPRIQTLDLGRLIGCEPSPNLLVRIENGIGRTINIEYQTSTPFVLADAEAGRIWPPLPFPVDVVSRVVVDDSLGNQYVTLYTYHDGYYDPAEKEFRGFGAVERREVGDATAPDLVMAYDFDTGVAEEALKGKTLAVEARSEGGEIFYREENAWQTRVLRKTVNGDLRAVTFPFQANRIRQVFEREETPVQVRWDYEYDDFGNVTRLFEHGRLDDGWDDERQTVTSYTAGHPSGQQAWILRAVVEETLSHPDGRRIAQNRSFYDGSLQPGQVMRGNLTRVEDWVAGNNYVISARSDFDTYGNVIALYDPLYGKAPGHYREVSYEELFHTYPIRESILTGTVTIAIQARYDLGFGVMISSTNFNDFMSTYDYDTFARLTSITRPPDLDHTEEYDYVLAHDIGAGKLVNWVETRQRDGSAGDGFLRSRTFSDGLGRALMTRMEGESVSQVVVTDAVQFNARRGVRKQYLPYLESGSLDYAAVSLLGAYTEFFYDPLGRELRVNQPEVAGVVAYSRTEYTPLAVTEFDEEQTDPDSLRFGSATRLVNDGLGEDGTGRLRQVLEIVKLSDIGEPLTAPVEWLTRYDYDPLDNLVSATDSQANQKLLEYDGLSRKTTVNDPNRGISRFKYDDASNLVESLDAKLQRITYTYDGTNRILSEDYHDATGLVPDVAYVYDIPPGSVDQGDGSFDTATNTLGSLTAVVDLSGEEHTAYDERGRVTWLVKRIADPFNGKLVSYKREMTYDTLDRVTSLVYPDKDHLTYEYNPRGVLDRIRGGPSGTIISGIDYTASEQVDLCTYGNGVSTNYTYDPRLRLIELKTTPAGSPHEALIHYSYKLDSVSNILGISDLRPKTVVPGGIPRRNHQTFAYDDLYRLTRVDYSFALPGELAADNGHITYRYDRIGNMLSKTSPIAHEEMGVSVTNPGNLAYGGDAGRFGRIGRRAGSPPGPHALSSANDGRMERTFTYDDNGNVETLDGKVLSWDFNNRLIAAEDAFMRAEYTYDHADRRVSKRVITKMNAAAPTRGSPDKHTLYVDRYFEIRENDQPVKYVYHGGVRIARIEGTLDSNAMRLQRLRIFAGWNLLTIVVAAPDAVAQLLDASSAVTDILVWNPGTKTYTPAQRGDALPAGSVFQLHSTINQVIPMVGAYSEPEPDPVPPQGVFMAVPGLYALSLERALPSGVESVWRYDASSKGWQIRFGGRQSRLSEELEYLPPGESFFVRGTAAFDLSLPPENQRIRYYHQDHGRSSQVVADADGNLLEETFFYPFGHPRKRYQSPSAKVEPQSYLFSQKELDRETGLQYFSARYYAGPFGRFISADPVGFEDVDLSSPSLHQNPYAFAASNPVNFGDPSGELISLLLDAGFAAYDTYQYASGQISGGEYAGRMALTGASVVAGLATAGTGGLAVRGAAMAVRAGKVGKAAMTVGRVGVKAAVAVDKANTAVSLGQAAISVKDAVETGNLTRGALSAAQLALAARGKGRAASKSGNKPLWRFSEKSGRWHGPGGKFTKAPTAAGMRSYAKSQGWIMGKKTGAGYETWVDAAGTKRMHIKPASTVPGVGSMSKKPRVTLRDESGQRVDWFGREVIKKSKAAHAPLSDF